MTIDECLRLYPEQTQEAAGETWGVIDTKGPPGAPVLVMLPGTLGTARIFWNQIAALGGRIRVILLTYPLLDDVVAITLVPGTQITHVDTLKIRGQLIDVFNGQASGLMLQLAGVATIDREAMTLYAKAVAVSALAVVGSSPVDRVVAHRLVGMTSPRCPHRYFTCRDEALEWLRSKPAS